MTPRLGWHRAAEPGAARACAGTAVLLHGAGTTTETPLLLELAVALAAAGVDALRVDQAYALGPRRPPPPAAQLDAVVLEVLASVPAPVVVVGRSSGARVGCRVARAAGTVVGVVALGFPLRPPQPPGREVSRAGELADAGVPVLVVQGTRDAFGGPDDIEAVGAPHVLVHAVEGADHEFRVRARDGRGGGQVRAEVIAAAVAQTRAWLAAPGSGQET